MSRESLPLTHHQERIHNFADLFRCCLPFRLQKQTSEKIHEKVNSAFGQVAATTISYTEFGYQNRF